MSDLKKLKLIFISHESSLSGAPILLLNLLRLLKKNGFNFSVVLKRSGELDGDFLEVSKIFILKPKSYQTSKFFLSKVVDYFFYRIRLISIIKEIKNADIVFSNTITNGRFLKQISSIKKPILTYVHELESVIQYYNRTGDSDLSFGLSSAFCSPSSFVTQNLLNHGISGKRTFPLNYYFPSQKAELTVSKLEKQKEFFEKHNIPFDKFYVAGMGTATFRKGIDLFIDACAVTTRADPNIHFVWLGDFIDEEERILMSHKIRELAISETEFTLTGFIPNNSYNLLPFDTLALTSKEDPYPLVVLEAALLKIPSIAFKGAGGMDEFIKDDAGFLLETRSASSLAEAILFLKENQFEILERGNNAFKRVKELHSNPSLILEQLDAAISYALSKQ